MKEKFIFACQSCGQQYSKWMGRCQQCGEWNSVVEERQVAPASSKQKAALTSSEVPQRISEIVLESIPRIHSKIGELDNVLGGGVVPGSVVLIGGEPGIGKSTLLLQAADSYAAISPPVLYVSGEESPSQLALRSTRLGIKNTSLYVVTETSLEKIQVHIDSIKPQILILDSVQTIYSSNLDSQPGSVGQLRECTYQVISLAKSKNIATFLVGHVTKEGAIAGPKVLEHMVDVVLYFEGTSSQSYRLLRAIKNRFGSTNELGVFEMLGKGLTSVDNPSELFLSERPTQIAGSVIAASVEGTRPILIEVQALASSTTLAIPRRTSIGLDPNRVSLLVAILEKRAGYRFFDQDVYVNIAGGLRVNEPAIDLGVVAALISSYSGRPVEKESVFFGEVGLGGEIRSVPQAAIRIKEAQRIGMKRAYVPKRVVKEMQEDNKKMEFFALDHIQELSDKL